VIFQIVEAALAAVHELLGCWQQRLRLGKQLGDRARLGKQSMGPNDVALIARHVTDALQRNGQVTQRFRRLTDPRHEAPADLQALLERLPRSRVVAEVLRRLAHVVQRSRHVAQRFRRLPRVRHQCP
jgi:hypothetical protein